MNKIKRTCFKCKREVMMWKENNGPWNYEELDGTPHHHAEQQQQLQDTNTTAQSTTTMKSDIVTFTLSYEELSKYTASARAEGVEQGKKEAKNQDIKQMHDENITAITRLTAAINRLADAQEGKTKSE